MTFITEIKTFAALGSGVIGSGWVARALAHGLDVVAWDPAPGAEAALASSGSMRLIAGVAASLILLFILFSMVMGFTWLLRRVMNRNK